MSVRSKSLEYSINSASTFASAISWSQLTQHKCEYVAKTLGLVWLTIISAGVSLMSIVWNSDKDPWNNIQNLSYLTNSQLYYIVLIIFKCTILFICFKFIAQYFIRPANLPTFYSHQFKVRIPGIKHKKNKMDEPSDPLLLISKDEQKYDIVPKSDNNHKKASIMNRDPTIPRNKYPYNRYSMICRYLCTSNWTLYNWMCIPVILFHLFHVIILINSFWCKKTSNERQDTIIQIIYHITRAFSDTMPGIVLITYWKAREIYDPSASYVKKYEKHILSKQLKMISASSAVRNGRKHSADTTQQNADRFKYIDNTKTLAAVHGILSACGVRPWLFFAIAFSLYNFLGWPALNGELFQHFLTDYKCESVGDNSESIYNDIYFILQICILRPFNGMIFVYTLFLTLPINRHHSSQLEGFKSILSPTIFGIIVLYEMAELRFFHHKIVHFILSGFMTVIYLFTIVWCLTLLCSLMALQSSADRQRNRFHGYREPQSVIVLFEGVFILILYVLLFGFILRNEENQQHTNYLINYVREAVVLIYNIVQLFMLFPLRTIAVEPGITKDYFLNAAKTKYITTFKWITLLNFVTFIYSFIFISNKYGDMIWGGFKFESENNYQNIHNAIYLLSYTFTFVMPYYALWIISQFDKWVNLNQNNLSYPESEFSVNNNNYNINIGSGRNGHSLSNDIDIKEQKMDSSAEQRLRMKSETEMSISSAQKIGNSYNLKASKNFIIKRSTAKTIKRDKFKKRERRHRPKSEGGKPLDINAMYNNGFTPLAHTPSIPENYDQTMGLFDPQNIPQFPEDELSISRSYDIKNVEKKNTLI